MFGISAMRVSVRPAWPWYGRLLAGILLAVCALLLARTAYDFGRKFAGYDQGEASGAARRMAQDNEGLRGEVERLSGEVAQTTRQSQIDRASVVDLAAQVKTLNNDNAALKEDLAFFETLMPAAGKEGITINRFKVERDALPGEYRYSLLVLQTGNRARDFQGRVQFVVNLEQAGKASVMSVPADGEANVKPYQLGFRFYQRVEGTFNLPPETVVKSVQVRVFESGNASPKLIQTATVS